MSKFIKKILAVSMIGCLIAGSISTPLNVSAASADMSVENDIKITASNNTGDFSTKYTSLLNNDATEIKPGQSATIKYAAYSVIKDGTVEYPSGYIGVSLKFKTNSNHTFYKFKYGNISVQDNVFCNIYDRYGINIGENNGGVQEISMSEASEISVKLEPNSEYIILLFAENQESLAGLSQSRIDISAVSDDIGDNDQDAGQMKFNQPYSCKLEGYEDYDYFMFDTKASDTFYNFAYHNKDINSDVSFNIYDERNEIVEEFTASKGEALSKTLLLNKNKRYYLRVHVEDGNVYDGNGIGNYQVQVNAVDDDYPDINSNASQLVFNTKYMAGIQHETDKDIIKFNSGDLTKFNMMCANESSTAALEYVIQSKDEESIIGGTINPGFIGNITLSSDNFIKNTDYYLVFSGEEGLKYNFTVFPIKHSIAYVLNGGVQNPRNPSEFNESSTVKLYEPTRTGFVFDGWYTTPNYILSADEYEEITSLVGNIGDYTEDLTLYAKWKSSGYTIFYNLGGGINHSDNPITFTSNTSDILLQNPSKVGCIFGGWYTSSDFSEGSRIEYIPRGTIGNITLYAKWITSTNRITYKLNGGKNNPANPVTYNAISSAITLKSPTRKGYIFDGWYTNEGFSGSRVYAINIGSTGNKTFYAKWTKAKVSKPIPKLSSKSRKVTVKWKKIKKAKGYQIKYSLSKKFKKATTINKKTSAKKVITKKLKKNSRCYVKMRCYTIDSTGKKVYSSWSKIKSLKVK